MSSISRSGFSYRSLHRSKPLRSLVLDIKTNYANARSLGTCSRNEYIHQFPCLTAIATVSSDCIRPACRGFPFEDSFRYEDHYSSIINAKKEDKSYRYFRDINRNAKEFPLAHSGETENRVNAWCTNDYVGLSLIRIYSQPSCTFKLTYISC